MSPANILVVNLGDTAAFVCTARGYPLPSVKWVEVSTGRVVVEESPDGGGKSSHTCLACFLLQYCSRYPLSTFVWVGIWFMNESPLHCIEWIPCLVCFAIVAMDSITIELMFSNVSSGNIGSYRCEATNGAGTVEERVILNLMGE